MAGARKLQAEIDRTLKKVEEGLELFDSGARKVETCDSASLKMKLEEELKKELKKLQKHRDSIKGWTSSSEVKIKTPLLDARASIEKRMELFKVIERESKMKAFSKEGLMRDAPLTAEDRRRHKSREWLHNMSNKLADEAEALEAELEALEEAAVGSSRKKGVEKTPEEKIAQIIKNHKFHVDKLELLAKAVDTGDVDPDEADALKGAPAAAPRVHACCALRSPPLPLPPQTI
jgi:CCR4-NOT transcription complex subunit 3